MIACGDHEGGAPSAAFMGGAPPANSRSFRRLYYDSFFAEKKFSDKKIITLSYWLIRVRVKHAYQCLFGIKH